MRLAWPSLLAYGMPGLPLAMLGLPLYVYLPTYYAEDLGMPLAIVGAVLLLARVIDTFTDPLIGMVCDHWPRGGARIGWMVSGAPLVMLGGWMLFVPSGGAGALYLAAWSCATYLGWSLMTLPYLALGAELSGDYHERSRIVAAREGFIVLGTLSAVLVPGWMEWRGASRGEALTVLAWLIVALVPFTVAALYALVDEPKRRAPAAPRIGWRLLRENAEFRRLLAAYLLNGIANGLPASLFLLFVTHVLAASSWIGLLLAIYLASGILALPLWLYVARRLGKHRTWVVSMLWVSAVFAFVPFLGAGDVLAFAAICALSGASLGADQMLPASMQADVIDVDTAGGGGSRAGLYFGLWGMTTKLALALAVGLAFPLLHVAGFEPTGDGDDGLLELALLYAGLPVLFKLAAIFVLRDYALDEQRQRALREQIAYTGGMQ